MYRWSWFTLTFLCHSIQRFTLSSELQAVFQKCWFHPVSSSNKLEDSFWVFAYSHGGLWICHVHALFQHRLASSPSAPSQWCRCTSCFPRTSRHPVGGAGPFPTQVPFPAACSQPKPSRQPRWVPLFSLLPIWESEHTILLWAHDLSTQLQLRALSLILYDLLIVGTWQGLFKGTGLGWAGHLQLTDRRWLGKKLPSNRKMKALLLLVLPWLSPANYTDSVGNLHFLYSELWVPLSPCLPVFVYWVWSGVGPESVSWLVCRFRGINSTCTGRTWTKHTAGSLKQRA